MNPLGDDFYEQYGEQWSSTDRRNLESLDTANKVKVFCALMANLSPKRIVDVGCGLGQFLDSLAQNFDVDEAIGIDVSSTMLGHARTAFPHRMFIHGDVHQLKNIAKLDLVTFIDVLEHLEDIPGTLNVAKRHARYIAVKVPLEKTWLISLLNNLGLKERKSLAYETEGHLYEFDQKELETIIESSGLEILCSTVTTWRPPKEVLFGAATKKRMAQKPGFSSRVKYGLYSFFSLFPVNMLYPIFEAYYGTEYYAVCQSNNSDLEINS